MDAARKWQVNCPELETVTSQEWGKSLGNSFYFAGKPAKLALNAGKDLSAEAVRKAAGKLVKAARAKNWKSMLLNVKALPNELAAVVVEGLVMGSYCFDLLKSKKKKSTLKTAYVLVEQATLPQCEAALISVDAAMRARDLCQMPPNVLHPQSMAEYAEKWAKKFGFECSVMGDDELQKAGFGAMLSVSQGSQKPAQLMVMDYKPRNYEKTIAFVGKAVTFDSGGLSLKPAQGMPEMKGDMAGGATVVGLMTALKGLNCKHRVLGIVPAVENMPSGSATRPSDVVTSLSGQTIEINNTDAEGRLILADALTHAHSFSPDYIIDFATLTGACLVALGPTIAGIMGNDQDLVASLIQSGQKVDESFWQLPLPKSYEPMLKSQTADFANVAGSRFGGAIVAGLFLQKFIQKTKWAHCDIACSLMSKADDLNVEGGSGFGVRTALQFLRDLS